MNHQTGLAHLTGMEAMTRPASHELPGLLSSAASGDEVAFGRIVAAHQSEMYGISVVVCRDRVLADEAVQAAWSKAWGKLGSVREPARLRPWLISIAVNEAKQLLRKRRRRTEIEIRADASEKPGGLDPATGIAGIDLKAAMQRLDPDDRALLTMRYVFGFDSTELAVAVGLSPSGTRARLQRLLARLRQELE